MKNLINRACSHDLSVIDLAYCIVPDGMAVNPHQAVDKVLLRRPLIASSSTEADRAPEEWVHPSAHDRFHADHEPLHVSPGKTRKRAEPLKAPRSADFKEAPHDHGEIPRSDHHQVSLGDTHQASKPSVPPTSGVAHVSECSFDQFTSQSRQLLAMLASGEEAQEVEDLGHGVLTYALLAGLQAAPSGPLEGHSVRPNSPDQVADVLEWFGFASAHVPRLTKKYFGKEQDVETSGQGTSFPVLPIRD